MPHAATTQGMPLSSLPPRPSLLLPPPPFSRQHAHVGCDQRTFVCNDLAEPPALCAWTCRWPWPASTCPSHPHPSLHALLSCSLPRQHACGMLPRDFLVICPSHPHPHLLQVAAQSGLPATDLRALLRAQAELQVRCRLSRVAVLRAVAVPIAVC